MKTRDQSAWGWYAGRHEEEFTAGPEATRDAIIQVGRCDFDGEGFHILEARKTPVDVAWHVSVESIVEMISESVQDMHGNPDDDLLFDPSPAETASLEAMLTAEIRRWQELHGIKIMPWAFTYVRNAEFIPAEEASR